MRCTTLPRHGLVAISIVVGFIETVAIGPEARGALHAIPVAEDESVLSGAPDRNFHDTAIRGGLFTGVDGALSGSAHFYLKFALPQFLPDTFIASARLIGFYEDDFDSADDGSHPITFVASDDWSEATLTWDTQPGPAYGVPESVFDAAVTEPQSFVAWDMPAIVDQEYRGDGTLSLLFRASNESLTDANRNWEYFVEKEFDPARGFRLEVTVAVPLPPALWSAIVLLSGLAAYGRAARRKHLNRA